LFFVLGILGIVSPPAQSQFTPGPVSATTIPAEQLMHPAELLPLLKDAAKAPVVLQVGSRIFFDQAHIAGSIYAGPGTQPAGLDLLDRAIASLSKNKFIVLYCGCCPWNRCPNVGPAFRHLRELGYTHVKVLYLYPIEHG
jgi:hypothetical protein